MSQWQKGENFWYHRDGLGSTVARTDGTGTVKKKYGYNEYGNMKATATEELANRFTFTGQAWDASAGLYENPTIGWFLTQDTWKGSAWEPWTQNLYVYVGNNPVNYVDPTGHWAQVAVLALAGAVLKAGFYAATHESSNTQDYWYEVGKAALTGATTALGVAADPAGAAVGAGIGFVNAAIHGELPDKLETGADWYQLVDALTGFNTAIGAAGGFGLQNFDQAAAGIGSEALKEVAALWGSLTTAQKVAIGTAALTALSGVTPTAGQSSSSTGGTNSSPGGGGPIKATAN